MIHLAGVHVLIGQRVVQRCSLCGLKLLDYKIDGANKAHFQIGCLVAVAGGADWWEATSVRMTRSSVFPEPWADSCIELIEGE